MKWHYFFSSILTLITVSFLFLQSFAEPNYQQIITSDKVVQVKHNSNFPIKELRIFVTEYLNSRRTISIQVYLYAEEDIFYSPTEFDEDENKRILDIVKDLLLTQGYIQIQNKTYFLKDLHLKSISINLSEPDEDSSDFFSLQGIYQFQDNKFKLINADVTHFDRGDLFKKRIYPKPKSATENSFQLINRVK